MKSYLCWPPTSSVWCVLKNTSVLSFEVEKSSFLSNEQTLHFLQLRFNVSMLLNLLHFFLIGGTLGSRWGSSLGQCAAVPTAAPSTLPLHRNQWEGSCRWCAWGLPDWERTRTETVGSFEFCSDPLLDVVEPAVSMQILKFLQWQHSHGAHLFYTAFPNEIKRHTCKKLEGNKVWFGLFIPQGIR